MQAQTIEEVITQLETIIEEAIQKKDRMGYFAVLYHKVTCRVRDGIISNEFENSPRMEQFDVLFANRFLDAWKHYKAGEQPTASWAITFEAAGKSSLLVLQHLLLGINAHINLDLGIAVVETMKGQDMRTMRGDYNKINTILSALSYEVINDIDQVSPIMSLMGLHANNGSSVLIQFTLENARDGAWSFAEELSAKTDAEYDDCIAARDSTIKKLAGGLIHSKGILNFTTWFIHLFEWKNVIRIIEVMRTYRKKYLKVKDLFPSKA